MSNQILVTMLAIGIYCIIGFLIQWFYDLYIEDIEDEQLAAAIMIWPIVFVLGLLRSIYLI